MRSIAIDIGQSGARAAVLEDGHVNATHDGLPGHAAGRDFSDRIGRILATLPGTGVQDPPRLDAITVGATGLWGTVPDPTPILRTLATTYGTTRLRVADDALTATLGAIGDQDGVVIAAGTGTVGLGRRPGGIRRVDGVGAMIGDDGSGWWIGRRGLIAALSAADGRPDGSPALRASAEDRFGPVADIPRLVAGAAEPIRTVASFATAVAEAARAGDRVAQGFWEQAGHHLAGDIIGAATGAGLEQPGWALVGNIARARDLFLPSLQARLDRVLPAAHELPVDPASDPLAGAILLDRRTGCEDLAPLAAEATLPATAGRTPERTS
jgi:glucosamine kinase